MPLDKLVAELATEMNEMKADVLDREDKLAALFKLTSSIVSDFDSETEDMIQKIHETRDEQVIYTTKWILVWKKWNFT